MNLEQQLAQIWAEVLNRKSVSADDNFFGLGADSVAVMMLVMRIEERFAVVLDAGDIYETPTLRALAGLLTRRLGTEQVRAAG